MHHKEIVIAYHTDCLDGFGAAYAAWKKFGDSADYLPLKHGSVPPLEQLSGREVYMVDFCYPQESMDAILKAAKSFVVLDHHEGIQDVIESMPNHVYDADRSGATIAWGYFHPDTPVPTLLKHLEDQDLYRFAMPDTRAIDVYLNGFDFSFDLWDTIAADLDDPEKHAAIMTKANAYLEYFNHLVKLSIDHAHPIMFEGHKVLMANTSPMKTLKSAVGNALAKKMPPFGLVLSVHPKGLGVSARGDGTVDLTVIAKKYGGNGHPKSAGFVFPYSSEMPFTSAEEHEHDDPRD